MLSRRILLPVGLLLLAVIAALSFWQFERVQARLYQEQRAALRTVFELSHFVQNGNGGLGIMARNRGFERVWVLSATGDILDSNRPRRLARVWRIGGGHSCVIFHPGCTRNPPDSVTSNLNCCRLMLLNWVARW